MLTKEIAKLDAQIDWLQHHWGFGENIHRKEIRILKRRRKQLLREMNPSLLSVWKRNWRLLPGLFAPVRIGRTLTLTRRHYNNKI